MKIKRYNLPGCARGFTLMEVILTIGLLAIFGVFTLEFLTSSWLGTEKDLSRIKCITAAENIIEMSAALGIANSGGDDTLIDTYKKIFSNDFVSVPPPNIDVATWSLISRSSFVHPDRIGNYMAKIATETGGVSTYTLFVGDASLANVVEIKTGYATQAVMIDYNFELGL